MRLLIFPLVVMAQTNMANLFNNNSEMTKLQERMTIARYDHLEGFIFTANCDFVAIIGFKDYNYTHSGLKGS